MDAVLRTVYGCLPPPPYPGPRFDLPCDGRGQFILSKLPLCIQWEIVSRLPVKDVVRLSVLSRYWYNFLLPEGCAIIGGGTEDSTAAERRSKLLRDPSLPQLTVGELTLSLGDAMSAEAAIGVTAATLRVPQRDKALSSVGRNLKLDRISFLPDTARQKIVACLPIRDAVRTKVLSRRWCHDWSSTPGVFGCPAARVHDSRDAKCRCLVSWTLLWARPSACSQASAARLPKNETHLRFSAAWLTRAVMASARERGRCRRERGWFAREG
jgi:hypothetical protein